MEKGIQINDRSTTLNNNIFDIIVKHDPRQMAHHQSHAVAKQYLQYGMPYDEKKKCTVEWHEKPNIDTPHIQVMNNTYYITIGAITPFIIHYVLLKETT